MPPISVFEYVVAGLVNHRFLHLLAMFLYLKRRPHRTLKLTVEGPRMCKRCEVRDMLTTRTLCE